MSNAEVDAYLQSLDESKRSDLEALRRQISEEIPEAEQGLSYGVPVFRIQGKPIAGFSAAKNHLSYLPHSGEIIDTLSTEQLGGFAASKGAIKTRLGTPLPVDLLRTLIRLRRIEAGV